MFKGLAFAKMWTLSCFFLTGMCVLLYIYKPSGHFWYVLIVTYASSCALDHMNLDSKVSTIFILLFFLCLIYPSLNICCFSWLHWYWIYILLSFSIIKHFKIKGLRLIYIHFPSFRSIPLFPESCCMRIWNIIL